MQLHLVCVAWTAAMLIAAQDLNAVVAQQDQPACSDVALMEKDRFNGTWALEQFRIGESEAKKDTPMWNALKDIRLVFKNGHVFMQGDQTVEPRKEVYTVNAIRKPKQLDIGKGRAVREYAYKFDDQLIIAFAPGVLVAGGTFAEVQRRTARPRDFKTRPETAPPNI